MKKSEFYNGIKATLEYAAGVPRDEWRKDGTGIVVDTDFGLVAVNCSRNVVTLYTKKFGQHGEKVVTDWNTGFKDNMVAITAGKIITFWAKF